MTVYLLHFDEKYKHAGHYLGYTANLEQRLEQHASGTGARLTQVVAQAGISWELARTWEGDRSVERRLKGYHSGRKLCPICNTR